MSLGIMPMQWDSHARTMRLMSVIIISLLLAPPHDAIGVSGDPFDWDALMLYALPLLRSSRTYQVSSSDPTGGNDDKGHYVEHRGNVAVLMDVKGAGCIYRIWSANPSGTLRIFVDDDNPILMMPFREIFTHHREPFIKPFVGRDGGGGYCYIPIPFARRCRVEVLNPPSLYYQITYCQRKSEAGISSFTPIKARASVRNWLKRWQRWLATPTPATQPQHYSKVTVLPNGKKALFALTGSGMITHLALRIKPFTLKALHSLRLQLYWDGERQPSIDCPIADLFCAAFGWVQSQSLFIDTSTHQLVLRLPMPYGNGARCEMVNEGKEAVDVECSLWTTPLPHPPSAYGRLHAQFHIATTQSDIPYTILDARGRGHLVGIVAALSGTSYEFLEGDLNVAVDGETQPSIRGTGTEDEFNGGWYFINGAYATPWAGAPLIRAQKHQVMLYRWFVGDCIPFQRCIRVTLEHGPKNNAPGCKYRSVAFWYQVEPHAQLTKPPPLSMRTPVTFTEPNVLEAERMLANAIIPLGYTVEVIADDALPIQLSDERGLLIKRSSRNASSSDGMQNALALELAVQRDDIYDVYMQAYTLRELPLRIMIGAQSNECILKPGLRAVQLARMQLKRGRHRIMLMPLRVERDMVSFIVDYFRLQPVMRVKGAFEAEELTVVEGKELTYVDYQSAQARIAFPLSPQWEGPWQQSTDLSAGGRVIFRPRRAGDHLTFRIELTTDGSYEVALGLTSLPNGGRGRAFWNGRPLGDAFSTKAKREYAWYQIGLGPTPQLTAGEHQLTIEALDARPIAIDYIVIQPAMSGYQAERLFITEHTAPVIIKRRFGAEPRWRANAYLKFNAQRKGDKLTLLLPIYRSGWYDISLRIACLPNGGQYHVLIDNAPIGGVIDAYAITEAPRDVRLGEVRLQRGTHKLTIRVVGKNHQSGGFVVGWDQISVELTRPVMERWHIALILASLFGITIGVLALWRWRRMMDTKPRG